MVNTDPKFQYEFNLLPQTIDTLKTAMRIAVIYGGNKTEPGAVLNQGHNSRPYKSYEKVAADIQTALFELGFEHVFLLADDLTLPQELQAAQIDFAWVNSCGVQGLNPAAHTPAMLEMMGIPYVGHNPLNATLLDNKHVFKNELAALGLPTAPFMTWNTTPGMLGLNIECFKRSFGEYPGPFIVKPISGRASLHVHVVPDRSELTDVISEVHAHTLQNVLIEQYLPGREYAVSVCGNVRHQNGEFVKQTGPFAFSMIERVLADDEQIFTSMDKRKITNDRVRLIDDPIIKLQLKEIAQNVFRAFSLRTLIRLDLRADESGNLAILEANPKPDLKRPGQGVTSLTAYGLEAENLTYHDLILSLVADRLDYLFSQRSNVWPHLIKLIKPVDAFMIPAAKPLAHNEFEEWETEKEMGNTAVPSVN